MKTIQVLFLIDEFDGAAGGTEQHLLYLLKHLPQALVKPHVAVLYPTGATVEALSPFCPLYLNAWRGWSLLGLLKPVVDLVGYVRRNGIDIIHTFFPTSETVTLMAGMVGM